MALSIPWLLNCVCCWRFVLAAPLTCLLIHMVIEKQKTQPPQQLIFLMLFDLSNENHSVRFPNISWLWHVFIILSRKFNYTKRFIFKHTQRQLVRTPYFRLTFCLGLIRWNTCHFTWFSVFSWFIHAGIFGWRSNVSEPCEYPSPWKLAHQVEWFWCCCCCRYSHWLQ